MLTALATHALPVSPASDNETLPKNVTSVSRSDLEMFRQKGDLQSQRRHVWSVIARLTNSAQDDAQDDTKDGAKDGAQPFFESWHGEDAVFADVRAEQVPSGIRGFSRTNSDQENIASVSFHASQSVDAPILTYTLYNDAAYRHIRTHRLHLLSELNRFRNAGPLDSSIVGDRSIPAFPIEAIILKTAWWPVAPDRLTALPVWDPEHNPPLRGGNIYTSWPRVVAVDPFSNSQIVHTTHIDFVGQSFTDAHRVDLKKFYHVAVDADMATQLNRDRSAKKAALIVLGRTIAAGDYLVLVGASLATKEISDWVWATFWWHDRPNEGPYAADRPAAMNSEWGNYLMQVAFDSDKPAALDGGPHICFNPWLEGRFPDSGHGGGTVSNCLTCHRRASYPPVSFLPVTRGIPDLTNDPAYAQGQLRTNFIWSLAMHAKP